MNGRLMATAAWKQDEAVVITLDVTHLMMVVDENGTPWGENGTPWDAWGMGGEK